MAIQGASPDRRRITPHLVVRDADAAVRFYEQAFGARELYRSPLPGGVGLHIHVRVADSLVMVTDENDHCEEGAPPFGSPQTLGGTSVVLELCVDDVDAAFDRAVAAGATPICPVMNMFWGDRYGMIRDPFGHAWSLATILEELTPEEIEERMAAMAG